MKRHKSSKRGLAAPVNSTSARLSQRVESVLELPTGSLSGAARIDFLGNRCVSIDGCKGIIEYCDDLVRLNTGSGILRFTGQNLSLTRLTEDSAVLEGCILSMEFLS